jgi:hypothetical protein
MYKHTPGPWSAERVWDIPETKVHAYFHGEPYALAEVYSTFTSGEREANAKLIAAAPDLLDALRAMREAFPSHGASMNAQQAAAFELAIATIDKATR